MKNKTTGNSAAASSVKTDKIKMEKEANAHATQSPPKRAGSVYEMNETAVQEFRERKKALKQMDAPEEDMMTAIERTRTAAFG